MSAIRELRGNFPYLIISSSGLSPLSSTRVEQQGSHPTLNFLWAAVPEFNTVQQQNIVSTL